MARINFFKKDANTIFRLFKIIHEIKANFMPLSILQSIPKVSVLIINTILPKYIIDEMFEMKRWEFLLVYIMVLILSNALFGLLQTFLNKKLALVNIELQHGLKVYLGKHIMNMDFEKIEDTDILDLKERALYPINMQNSLNELIESISNLINVLISIISLFLIVSQLSVLLLIGILLFNIASLFVFKKEQINFDIFYDQLPQTMRRSMYYESISSDYKSLKDVQIYKGKALLLEKLKTAQDANVKLFDKVFNKNGKYEGLIGIITHIQLIFIYIFCIYNILNKMITFGSFTMYINASTQFASQIQSIFNSIILIHQNCKYLEVYFDFLDIKSHYSNGHMKIDDKHDLSIEFSHVYFHYPNQKEYILKDISVTIRPGEKISIIGMNGAGKTTFVKLLCRLYQPSSGTIYLNGVNIECYSFDQYISIISTVFQDYKLFDFSFKENIVLNNPQKDVLEVIQKAGLKENIEKCSNGIDTNISKKFDESGIELSGGESQKLAIARAIYKDTPILVLDEPTAALDPYAEYEIYKKFDEISIGKTILYISHRLSSCLLSDRIFVFDHGEIVEEGTHKELKERENGIYKKLWDVQAKYYI